MRFQITRALLLAILVFGLLLSSSSVVSGQQQDTPRYGGTLIIAMGNEVPSLNPVFATAVTGATRIFSSLLQYDTDYTPKPDLAETWEISEDGLVYTFHLVRNAFFHDGVAVTSADVKFSIEEVVIPFHPNSRAMWGDLDSIETPDDYTVVIKLKKPYSPLIFLLGLGGDDAGSPIFPKHLYEGTDIQNNPHNDMPIGSGPFKFVSWERGNQLIVERNENYFREGLPYLDRIILRIIPDATARGLAIERGEVNYVHGILASDIQRLRDLENIEVELGRATGDLHVIKPNLENPILNNLKVRRAIAHAIDKDLLVERVFFGEQKAARGPVASSISWAFNPNLPVYEFNPEKANVLLDEAGYPRGDDGMRFSLRLHTVVDRAETLKMGEIVREQLRDVGIDVRVINLEGSAWADAAFVTKDYDMNFELWSSAPDPTSWLTLLFHSKTLGAQFGNRDYTNPSVDQLIDAANLETDRQNKAQLLQEAQDILVSDLPFFWLVESKRPSAYTKDFVGLLDNPFAVWGNERMERVWWTGGSESAPGLITPEV
ncbi:MAG: ABC transporter substrate-binding protein, partial [Candidatus Bathyarchaeia archaeon]